MGTKKVTFETSKGAKSCFIQKVEAKMTQKERDKMIRRFNNEVRVIEWVGGCTYYFMRGAKSIKSASIDELQEMYKADYNGLPIPERKCFFTSN